MKSVELSSHLLLRGITKEECAKIEKDLTFKNPQYEKVKKYSKWSTTNVPEYLEYFTIFEDKKQLCARVPIGYNIDISGCKDISDLRVLNKVEFPEFMFKLRGTQDEAKIAYMYSNRNSYPLSGSVQMPTGKGKTILGIYLASVYSAKTLIIVHKDDLVKGWKSDIEQAFQGKADVGLIKAKSRKVGKHFTIATIQTLNRLTEKELNILYNTFGLVIQDEMHHCPSTSFEIGNNFNCRYRLGLTATPERSDGLENLMTLFYGDFSFTYSSDGDDEDILQVCVARKRVPIFFDPVVSVKKVPNQSRNFYKLKDLDYQANFDPNYDLKDNEVRISGIPFRNRPDISHMSLDGIITLRPETMELVCRDIYQEYNKGLSCIAFFQQKEQVLSYRDYLIRKGVPESKIGLYYGDNKDCDIVLDTAENNRQFITLATYSKATEGTNCKQWEVGFLVSSINNGKNTEQAVGRIRRVKFNDKLPVVRLYDYDYSQVYQLKRHTITRETRYKKLKLQFNFPLSTGLFSRGYR